jgi:carboxypeptidase Taq
MSLFQNSTILKILEDYKTIWALNHLIALASWDHETYMPEFGVNARGTAMAKVSGLTQNLFLNKKFVDLIKKANDQKNLTDAENGVLRLLNKSLKEYQNLPQDFIEEFVEVTTGAQVAWRNARAKNDYSIFKPFLEKIINLSTKQAEYLGYEKYPYDALLDQFEEGLTTEYVDKFFNSIRDFLKTLLSEIKSQSNYSQNSPIELAEYDHSIMKKTNYSVLDYFHYDSKKLRLDKSSHPFSLSLGNSDIRITTRYLKNNFASSLFSTIHEFGHGLYNQQSDDELAYSPIDGGVSLVIHESQSRFWENMIGRNRKFIEKFYPQFLKLNKDFKKYSVDDFYYYFNQVKPDLIRVEADEVTYHFHIMIRFEIEKMMMAKEVNVDELPELWNSKYKEYLGVSAKENDFENGILQDIHWSQGAIGYFPTYSLGTILSAVWKSFLEKDLGDFSELLTSPEGIQKIKDWLKTNIHQYGGTYTLDELVQKVTGEDFSTKYWKEYLRNKYTT